MSTIERNQSWPTLRGPGRMRGASGRIESRLLVNALVDPAEVAPRLPRGLRPHVTAGGGSVVGCCLLGLSELRLVPMPAGRGQRMWAVAHRVSVEWTLPSGEVMVGVYVPERFTGSRLATLLSGRLVPGVHRHARLAVDRSPGRIRWWAGAEGASAGLGMAVDIDTTGIATDEQPEVGRVSVGAQVALSPDRRGGIEAVHMQPNRTDARPVHALSLSSTFLDGFASAVPASTYLMERVDVTWTPVPSMVPLPGSNVAEPVR